MKMFIKDHIIGHICPVRGWDIDQVAFTSVGKTNVNTAYSTFRVVPAITDMAIDGSRTNGHNNGTK